MGNVMLPVLLLFLWESFVFRKEVYQRQTSGTEAN